MEREQRLLQYFNKLSSAEKDIAIGKVAEVYKSRMVELEAVGSAEGMFPVEELADKISKRIRQILRESEEKDNSAGTVGQRHPQKVTRRGIRVNGKEYWDDLFFGYVGKTVNVVVTPDVIRVEDMDKSVITTFTPA